jgi:hypothetical protein
VRTTLLNDVARDLERASETVDQLRLLYVRLRLFINDAKSEIDIIREARALAEEV